MTLLLHQCPIRVLHSICAGPELLVSVDAHGLVAVWEAATGCCRLSNSVAVLASADHIAAAQLQDTGMSTGQLNTCTPCPVQNCITMTHTSLHCVTLRGSSHASICTDRMLQALHHALFQAPCLSIKPDLGAVASFTAAAACQRCRLTDTLACRPTCNPHKSRCNHGPAPKTKGARAAPLRRPACI